MDSEIASLGDELAGARGAVEGAMGGESGVVHIYWYVAPRSGDEERHGENDSPVSGEMHEFPLDGPRHRLAGELYEKYQGGR